MFQTFTQMLNAASHILTKKRYHDLSQNVGLIMEEGVLTAMFSTNLNVICIMVREGFKPLVNYNVPNYDVVFLDRETVAEIIAETKVEGFSTISDVVDSIDFKVIRNDHTGVHFELKRPCRPAKVYKTSAVPHYPNLFSCLPRNQEPELCEESLDNNLLLQACAAISKLKGQKPAITTCKWYGGDLHLFALRNKPYTHGDWAINLLIKPLAPARPKRT
jgi:hypothetical protein